MEPVATEKRPRFFYGWIIVAVSFLGDGIALGAGNSSFSVFLKPMSDSLGWSRTTFTGAVTVQTLLNLVANPVVGYIVDRYGPKIVMVVGALVAGVCYLLLGKITEPWQFYVLYAAAVALGLHEVGQLVTTATISKWFIRMRGRALAMASAGSSFGQIIFAPLCAFLVVALGWRDAWGVLGVVVMALILPPAILFMRRMPEDMGLRPDGDAVVEAAATGNPRGEQRIADVSWSVKEALRTRTLWTMVLAFNLASVAYSGIIYHLIPYYTDIGFSLQTASLLMALTHVFSMASKLPWGLAAERFPVRYCIMVMLVGRAAGLLSLLLSTSPLRVFGYVVIAGSLSYAMGPLQAQIWADYYGRRFIGSIRGILAPFSLISSLGGPLFAAFIYDRLGSYNGAFSVFVVSLLLAVCVLFFAKPPAPLPAVVSAAMVQPNEQALRGKTAE